MQIIIYKLKLKALFHHTLWPYAFVLKGYTHLQKHPKLQKINMCQIQWLNSGITLTEIGKVWQQLKLGRKPRKKEIEISLKKCSLVHKYYYASTV